jgi:DNA repair protein RecN (Recombination protein N)
MLRELRIENLLLIERAELRFEAGLNAITGETGAGKTVLAHSIDLLLGGKPRSGIVRPGAPEAWVEGVFDLPSELRTDEELAELLERVPEGEEEVAVARRVSAAGRSSAFLAGRAASAADLRLLGGRLLSFYGQHEHRRLTLASVQAEILDGFAGEEHLALRERYREAQARLLSLRAELTALRDREGARERDLDLLRFELAEIDEVAPEPGEHEALRVERDRLRGSEDLRTAAAEALLALAGSGEDDGGAAAAAVALAEGALVRGGGVDAELDRSAERVAALGVELADVAGELRGYLDGLEADPARLEELESRLEAIERLLRKHGGSVETVLAYASECRERIAAIEGAGEREEALAGELKGAAKERDRLAAELTAGRERAAPQLERAVAAELTELAMEGARLEVALHPADGEDGHGHSGAESVELLVAPNPGLPLSPLRDSASGGELSRVMLALAGLGAGAGKGTLVFDEIDAGIGGQVARRVGERLKALGERRQVVCITHLPQVASLAGAHYRVEKQTGGETARARVERVGGEELVAEIVRMLGAGDDDEAADRHARELLAA